GGTRRCQQRLDTHDAIRQRIFRMNAQVNEFWLGHGTRWLVDADTPAPQGCADQPPWAITIGAASPGANKRCDCTSYSCSTKVGVTTAGGAPTAGIRPSRMPTN